VHLMFLDFSSEMLVMVFDDLEPHSLVSIAATCSIFYSNTTLLANNTLEQMFRERIENGGNVFPDHLPPAFSSWAMWRACMERRREERLWPWMYFDDDN
jgi:hypothetical protein